MKKQKRKKYELHLTFTKRQMEKIREEVAYRMGCGVLRRKKSVLDELCYTIAWTFHQTLSGRKVKNGACQ